MGPKAGPTALTTATATPCTGRPATKSSASPSGGTRSTRYASAPWPSCGRGLVRLGPTPGRRGAASSVASRAASRALTGPITPRTEGVALAGAPIARSAKGATGREEAQGGRPASRKAALPGPTSFEAARITPSSAGRLSPLTPSFRGGKGAAQARTRGGAKAFGARAARASGGARKEGARGGTPGARPRGLAKAVAGSRAEAAPSGGGPAFLIALRSTLAPLARATRRGPRRAVEGATPSGRARPGRFFGTASLASPYGGASTQSKGGKATGAARPPSWAAIALAPARRGICVAAGDAMAAGLAGLRPGLGSPTRFRAFALRGTSWGSA